jgi:hypothetical protein
MSIELKIKYKHLALEPAIIRKEEQKVRKQLAWFKEKHQITDIFSDDDARKIHSKWYNLYHHRITAVRYEARATHLARAYLAGVPYEKVESKRHEDHTFIFVILPRVYSMVAKYGLKKLQKKWNRDKSMFMYDEIEWKEFTSNIKKWCNVE